MKLRWYDPLWIPIYIATLWAAIFVQILIWLLFKDKDQSKGGV